MTAAAEARTNGIQGTRKRNKRDLFERLGDCAGEEESERVTAADSAQRPAEVAEEPGGVVLCCDTGTGGLVSSKGEMPAQPAWNGHLANSKRAALSSCAQRADDYFPAANSAGSSPKAPGPRGDMLRRRVSMPRRLIFWFSVESGTWKRSDASV
jgi:hypothetical protein